MQNIDVSHQEHNVVESIVRTCLDIMGKIGKTKDNVKVGRDLAEIYNHPTFELTESGGKPLTPFCLKLKDRKEVLRWIKKLKFPDGLKSHDYHIIMERLIL
jgi:hypothetical protein